MKQPLYKLINYFFAFPTINKISATITTIIITVVHIPALKIVPMASQLEREVANANNTNSKKV